MKLLSIAIAISCLLLTANCQHRRTTAATSLVSVDIATNGAALPGVRALALKQTARGVGAQAGLAWRSQQLNRLLTARKAQLDRIFDFNYLLLNQNVLPPILVESRNNLNLADELTIRASDHDYQIIQPPRFITTTPHWRNYLWMNYAQPEQPNSSLLPQNRAELQYWHAQVKLGWENGIEQANEIFYGNLQRLQRDYQGMILYRKLLAQNMVTMPYVSKADLGITGGGDELHINDRILRITTIPVLKTDTTQWRPVITT